MDHQYVSAEPKQVTEETDAAWTHHLVQADAKDGEAAIVNSVVDGVVKRAVWYPRRRPSPFTHTHTYLNNNLLLLPSSCWRCKSTEEERYEEGQVFRSAARKRMRKCRLEGAPEVKTERERELEREKLYRK